MNVLLFQQLKRKLEDVSRKLESLYDALRESKVQACISCYCSVRLTVKTADILGTVLIGYYLLVAF